MISGQATVSEGAVSSGFPYDHLGLLSATAGSPRPKPLPSRQSQWIALNQSPLSYELRSSDLERSRSVPAWESAGPWESAAVAIASTCIRARSLRRCALPQLEGEGVVERLVVVRVRVGEGVTGRGRVSGGCAVVVDLRALDRTAAAVGEGERGEVAGEPDLDQVLVVQQAGLLLGRGAVRRRGVGVGEQPGGE